MIIQHYKELLRLYRGRLLLLVIISATIFSAVSVIKLRVSPTYTATASVLITPTEAELAYSSAVSGRAQAERALTETYIEYVKSRPIIEAALEKIGYADDSPTTTPMSSFWGDFKQQARDLAGEVRRWWRILDSGEFVPISERDREIQKMREAITIDKVVDSHIMRIAVDLPDARKAAELANTLAQAYVERMSEEQNKTILQLEQRLNQEIERLETNRERLQGQLAALKRRQGEVVEDNDQQYQLDLVQQQLTSLYARMLNTNLTRESIISQVRVIEPAVEPVYPSSPHVLTNTLLGLLTGLLLGIIIIVIWDTASDTVKTTADLARIAGVRSLGLLRRSWITKLHKRELRQLGNRLERRLSALGDFETSHLPVTSATPTGPFVTTNPALPDHQQQTQSRQLAVGSSAAATGLHGITGHRGPNTAQLQVTGFSDIRTICLATLGLAASLALQGRYVVCRLPAGVFRNPVKFEKNLAGRLKVQESGMPLATPASDTETAIIVDCLGPLSAGINLSDTNHQPAALICIVPQNHIQENLVDALQDRALDNPHINLSFMLMRS